MVTGSTSKQVANGSADITLEAVGRNEWGRLRLQPLPQPRLLPPLGWWLLLACDTGTGCSDCNPDDRVCSNLNETRQHG